jgi:biotin operon repressor
MKRIIKMQQKATTEKEPFYKLSKVLMRATKIEYIHEGVVVVEELPLYAKIVYTHMLDQHTRFSKDNKEYFQMQETIALEIGVSVSTVKRSIRQLEKIGLVEVARKKSLDKKRNKYKLHKFSELSNIRLFSEGYKLAGGDGWFWSSGKNIEKIIPIKHSIVTERKQAEPVVDPYLYNNYEFEDDGCPF